MTDTNKLLEIQRDLKVLKTQFNAFGNYSYRTSEDILLALKPLLVKHDAVLTITDNIHPMNEHVYVEAIAMLKVGSETYQSSSFARDAIIQKGMSASQCTNSASSFARKQALSGLFLLDDTATIILSREEQEENDIKMEAFNKEQAAEKVKHDKKLHDEAADFLKESEIVIKSALSLEELISIYKVLWKKSKNYNATSAIEAMYKEKKEIFK